MSVLLDALKKAAAEKKAKQAEKNQFENAVESNSDSTLADVEYSAQTTYQRLNKQNSVLNDDSSYEVMAAQTEDEKNINSVSPTQNTPSFEHEINASSLVSVSVPPVEPKFKLAEQDMASSPSKLMDVLGDTVEVVQDSEHAKSGSSVDTQHRNPSRAPPSPNLSDKKSELEALFKPGDVLSSQQRALQAKQVKKLFTPALTTALKPIKSSFSRKIYLFFLGLAAFTALLIYFALFMFKDLEQQYDRQVQQFASTINKPILPAKNETAKSHEAIIDAYAMESMADHSPSDKNQIKPREELSDEPKPVQAQQTSIPDKLKQTSESHNTTRPASNVEIRRVIRIDENELAYQAYLESDFDKAEYHYRRGLAENPNSKNSQIGLAAVAAQGRDYELAMSYYQRVLQQNSNDQDALQGMASIASELGNQEAMMEDLIGLVRRYPDSASLQFALGNQYAQRQDWFKAQQHYFDSVRLEQNNPDYRLNLAVSLDHLGQFKQALEQYKLSLAFADKHSSAQINRASVYQRINLLQTFMEQN